MNDKDRTLIKKIIVDLERAGAGLEELADELECRAGNVEEFFPDRAEQLGTEAEIIRAAEEAVDEALTEILGVE